MTEVVELRVHGVGGTPPEHLLGVASEDIVRVGGEDESAFYARRDDRSVEGYSWGPLTAKPFLQPLWILLLPFTLMNVAGWMLPRPSRAGGWQIARILIFLLGLSLTVSYVFGLSSVITKQVFVQSGVFGLIENDRKALIWGAVSMVVLGLLTVRVAGKTQRRFELTGTSSKSEGNKGYLSALCQWEDLGDAKFWRHFRTARRLLCLHGVVGVLALALYFYTALGEFDSGTMELGVGPLFAKLGLVQFALVVALILTCLAGFRRPIRTFATSNFRVFGPVMATSTAFGLAGGFIAGFSIIVGKALGKVGEFSRDVVVAGPELKMNLAFGFGMLTFALSLLLFFLLVRCRWARSEKKAIEESGQPPLNTALPADQPNGLPQAMLGRLARARAFAGALRHIDLLLTVPAIPFGIAAFVLLVNMQGWSIFGWRPHLGWQDEGWLGNLSDVGGWIAALAVGYVLVKLRQDYLKPDRRRLVGILWDVLTFWPRRFHPLAVRPYAERAVHELEIRLRYHLSMDDRRILLSAHSQGSVLAFAALSQIAASDPELLQRISFLTYGCPLDKLHGRFFPAYFCNDMFATLETQLFQGEVELDGRDASAAASWFNFFRETDYIGQEVPIGEFARHNELLEDPPETPVVPRGLIDPFPGPPDDPLPAWVRIAMHSHYNKHPRVKAWVVQARTLLLGPPPI